MRTVKKMFVLCLLAALLGGCIPDNLDNCPPEQQGGKVDISIDMDTDMDMDGQETEMP